MFDCKNGLLSAAIVLAGAVWAPGVQAMLVFDPTNYSQTTITAIQSVQAQVTRLQQLRNDINQSMNKFGGSDLARLKTEYDKVKGVYDSAMRLKNTVVGVNNDFNNVKAMFGSSSNRSFVEFAQDIQRRSQAGDAVARNLYDSSQKANEAMKQAYEQHEKLVQRADNVTGVTEAAQSTTAAVGILIQQNNSMLAMMSADQLNKSLVKSENTTRQQSNDEKESAYYQGVAEQLQKIRNAR